MSRSQPLLAIPSQLLQPVSQVGTQAPDVHTLLPREFVQASPHAEQLVAVPSGSQVPSPPQSSKPAAHPVMAHVPPAHDSVAFGMSQGMPQSPQSVRVRTFLSQPLFGSESQLLKPVEQTGVQPEVVLQLVVPFALVHTSVHERQRAVLPSVDSQLPLLSQSAVVGSHVVATQAPVTHVSPDPGTSHTAPQLPQSVRVRVEVSQPFAALPSHMSQPALQVYAQLPLLQAAVPRAFTQPAPQAEQFVVVLACVSQPGEPVEQSNQPGLQLVTEQVPVAHVSVEFGRSQATPQSPQSARVRMFFSQPLPRSPSQLLYPTPQVGLQPRTVAVGTQVFAPLTDRHVCPLAQDGLQLPLAVVTQVLLEVPFGATQASPQPRQLEVVPSVVSQPAAVVQSARPALQPVRMH